MMFQPRNIISAKNAPYYPVFDFIRTVAALGVFVDHSGIARSLPHLGNACVQLFFALSGFLIGGILLTSKKEDLPRFFFNRGTRIWIPYAIAIAILFALTAVKQGLADPKVREFFVYMVTFVYNWFGPAQLAEFKSRMPLEGTANHFWSICVEEQFYLVAPFLIVFLPRAMLPIGLAVASLITPGYFASISAGVLLAIIGPRLWIAIACGLAGSAFAFAGVYIVSAALISTAVICAAALVKAPQSVIGRIGGGASYPFYLNHWIGLFAINAVTKIGLPYWLAWSTGLAVAVAISVVHYFVIDRSIAVYRDRWFTMKTGFFLGASAFALVAAGFAYASMQ